MKYFLISLVSMLLVVTTHAQTAIRLEDVNKHIGETAQVCGQVYSTSYMQNARHKPTYLNIGTAANTLLTIVIWDNARKDFKEAPEEWYKGKQICITWKIERVKDKLQIVANSPAQLGEAR